MNAIWVVVADGPAVGALLAAGHRLDGPVRALVIGSRELADQVSAAGEQVDWLPCGPDVPVAALARAAAAHVLGAGPVGVVLTGTGPGSRAVAGALAAALGAEVLADVRTVDGSGDGTVTVTHLLLGGLVEQQDDVDAPVVLVMDGGSAPEPAAAGTVQEVEVAADARLRRIGGEPALATGDDLRTATRIVGVGRGLRTREDLALVETLASALDAQIGCSRPLAEGLGWLPTDRYLGVSGLRVAPQLYVALGISGQLQHMIGVRDAEVIVAVNTDPDALVVSQADWTVVGDLYDVVPALVAALARVPAR